MSDTRTSFAYDPARQGYDTNSWRTLSGAPAVTGSGRMVVDAGTGIAGIAVHYADFLKGDISFNINVPTAPAAGDRMVLQQPFRLLLNGIQTGLQQILYFVFVGNQVEQSFL